MSTGKQHSRPTIGMGVLSWRGAASLDHALDSYHKTGLYTLFDEAVIILPDPDSAVLSVTKKHPLTAHEFPQNLGIAGGMRAVAETLSTDYVLFLENDCPLIETRDEAERQIDLAVKTMEAGAAFMTRLRSRREPGELFDTLEKYKRYWDPGLAPALHRTLRPFKGRRLSGSAVYDSDASVQRHPHDIHPYDTDSYRVSARVMPWTNQSILLRRRDFLDIILPYVDAQPLTRTINGFHNIETQLNRSAFWRDSGYQILCPPGLFTHKRLQDRGY